MSRTSLPHMDSYRKCDYYYVLSQVPQINSLKNMNSTSPWRATLIASIPIVTLLRLAAFRQCLAEPCGRTVDARVLGSLQALEDIRNVCFLQVCSGPRYSGFINFLLKPTTIV